MKVRTGTKEVTITIEKDDDTATFTGTPLTVKEINIIKKKHLEQKNVEGLLSSDDNYLDVNIEKIQKIIRAWDVVDDDGEIVPCTAEMKKTVYINNPILMSEVLGKFEKISYGIADKEEEKKTT